MGDEQESTPEQRRALFRVVAGSPDDAELAALAAVVAAGAGGGAGNDGDPVRTPDLWSDPGMQLRAPLHAGPGAWRASGLPT